jgi:hypothetical protein
MRRLAFSLWVSSVTAGALLACTVVEKSSNPLPLVDDDAEVGEPRPPRDAGSSSGDPVDDGASKLPGRVFAHTPRTLYLFEPHSKQLTEIGELGCLAAGDRVLDIALDRTGVMYATTDRHFLSVDPTNADCSSIREAAGAFPNSLSFVPAGTVDATKEALVGYAFGDKFNVADQYVRIDTGSGEISVLGELNPEDAPVRYKSSGDMIALIQDNSRAYLTVKLEAAGPEATDYVAEVNPTTGAIVRILGSTGQSNLFGLGYWAGKGYGFTDKGQILQIDMTDGSSVLVSTLLSGDGGAVPWYGAGVTTQAPVAP